jgi:flagellar protein FlgJ
MNVSPATSNATHSALVQANLSKPPPSPEAEEGDLRTAFLSFAGQTLFGQLLKAMRKTVGKPAYFHGGRTEEIFQQQLDQVLAEKISNASADKFGGPMFELFAMKRR